MTPKQIARRLETLKAQQVKLRDEMRRLISEIEEHFDNANEAVEALDNAADAVSRLL